MSVWIQIGGYECSGDPKVCLDGLHHRAAGHAFIHVWRQDPWIRRADRTSYLRASWASLEFLTRLPQSETEQLRWAVKQLAVNLEARAWPADEDDVKLLIG